MRISDLILLGLKNLWQAKVRSVLTILGVIIGIGALSSLVSFGTGMQKSISDEVMKSDLFTTVLVYPQVKNEKDTIEKESLQLNDSVLEKINHLDCIELAYPLIQIPVKAILGQNETSIFVQIVPYSLNRFSPFKKMKTGRFLRAGNKREVVITPHVLRFLKFIEVEKGGSISMEESRNGYQAVFIDTLPGKTIRLVSLTLNRHKIIANPAILMHGGKVPLDQKVIEFVICGVSEAAGNFGMGNSMAGIYTSEESLEVLPNIGFSSVWEALSGSKNKSQYSSFIVKTSGKEGVRKVRGKIEDMGFKTSSVSDQLGEMRKGFIIIDSLLGAIGLVALAISSLGIINTMLMSILERTREIGIMKSIGATDRQIRLIFLTEASAIGFIGAGFGLVLGYGVSRFANWFINNQLLSSGEPTVDVFYFTWWIVAGALAFSIIISLLSGLYPAIRASKIDPVKALRHD